MPYYTDLEDIKRVLRSSDKEVVRFSQSLVSFRIKRSEDLFGFDDSEIEYNDSFDDKLSLEFHFSDSETFDVYRISERRKEKELLATDNSVNEDFEYKGGEIVIKPNAWFGDISSGDEIELQFDPHMSNKDADKYIEDVEIEIDSVLMKSGLDKLDEDEDRLFEDGDVPPQIKTAATYLSAYYIFTDVFATVYKDGDPSSNYSGRWKKRAEKHLENYIVAENLVAPRSMAFPKYIDRVGVATEGPGTSKMVEDDDDFKRDSESDTVFKREFIDDVWNYVKDPRK